ncbi:MAG TPA: response regulator transcription factor [Chloroflexota bacterium]|nr:response regulator transcription factor [Chloroflexota bacterium]
MGAPAVDPASVPSRPQSTQPAPESRTRRTIRVLLVDDEPDVRAALRALLEDEANIAVVGEAGDGVEAICATERLRPDVLLLDLAMPGIAGAEAAKVLRQTAPETRIVVLTGTGPARAPELLRLDVHGYLCKPVQGPELADALRAVHGGGVCLAPAAARWLAAGEEPAAPPEPTPREREALRLLAEGCPDKEIARRLRIHPATARTHVRRLFAKAGVHSKTELVARAYQLGWLGPEPDGSA